MAGGHLVLPETNITHQYCPEFPIHVLIYSIAADVLFTVPMLITFWASIATSTGSQVFPGNYSTVVFMYSKGFNNSVYCVDSHFSSLFHLVHQILPIEVVSIDEPDLKSHGIDIFLTWSNFSLASLGIFTPIA
jgi:predicted neutral ceramidase superfamily lipid hydrolase